MSLTLNPATATAAVLITHGNTQSENHSRCYAENVSIQWLLENDGFKRYSNGRGVIKPKEYEEFKKFPTTTAPKRLLLTRSYCSPVAHTSTRRTHYNLNIIVRQDLDQGASETWRDIAETALPRTSPIRHMDRRGTW
jgi:hypothetical protein